MQNNTENKQFYTAMAITKAKKHFNSDGYYAIASSHVIFIDNLKDYALEIEELLPKLRSVYEGKLNIVLVSPEYPGFSSRTIDNDSQFTIIEVTRIEFFSKEVLNHLLIENTRINQTIFLFKNLEYRDVVNYIGINNIIISGGSNTHKHVLSPIQLRLARFIIGISKDTRKTVAQSYHYQESSDSLDFTNKEVRSMVENLPKDPKDTEELIKYLKSTISKSTVEEE